MLNKIKVFLLSLFISILVVFPIYAEEVDESITKQSLLKRSKIKL